MLATAPMLRLPLEILEMIIDIVPIKSQLSIGRTTKLLHLLTTRHIYRDICLTSPADVVACCLTLKSKPTAAAAVKHLSIGYPLLEKPNRTYFFSYYQLIGAALKSLIDVQEIQLMVYDPHLVTALHECNFSHLRKFHCYLALTEALVSFLNRHPKINHLQLSPQEDITPTRKIPPIILPHLEYFAGNGECLTGLGCDIPLRAAFVFWDAVDQKPQDVISVLERSPDLKLLSCRRRGWNLDLLDIISSRVPDIYVLSITNVLVVDSPPSQDVLDTLRTYLSRFTDLKRLLITCIDYWQLNDVKCEMDEDFQTVIAFGKACPSLVEITMPHSEDLAWYRVTDDIWLPDSRSDAGSSWLYDKIRARSFPGWEKILGIFEDRMRKKLVDPEEVRETLFALDSLVRDQDVISDEDVDGDGNAGTSLSYYSPTNLAI